MFLHVTEVLMRMLSVCLFPFFEIVLNFLFPFCLCRCACVTLTVCDVIREVVLGAEHLVALTLHGSVLCHDLVAYF